MRGYLALAVLVFAGGAALADEPPESAADSANKIFAMTLPEEWQRHAEVSQLNAGNVRKAAHFGGAVRYQAGADSFTGPDGMAFNVSWAGAVQPVDDPAAVLRAETDRLKRLWCGEGKRERLTWKETISGGLVDALLAWQHHDDGVVSASRTLVYANQQREPRLVMAECVMRADVAPALGPLCDKVLASLALTIETPLAVTVPDSTIGDRCADEPSAGDVVPRAGATIGAAGDGAGSSPVLYAGEGKGESGGSDSKLWMLGGVVLLVIAVYLTTRNRREDVEEDAGDEPPAEPPAADDDDGDDGDGDDDDDDDDETDDDEREER